MIKDEVGKTFSRRDLVLNMANKDGGAHIDPVLTGKYRALARQNSLGWQGSINNQSPKPVPHPERAAVRQIAHEVLKSIDPAYTKDVPLGSAYFVAYNVLVMLQPLKEKFEPDELCPCGSGNQYQHCHGK